MEEEAKSCYPEASAASVAIVDASCGGGALHLRGRAGAAAAVDFVVDRRGWRAAPRSGAPFAMRGAEGTSGLQRSRGVGRSSGRAQCDSLRRLVKLLRTQPVLLDGRRGSSAAST